MKPSKTKPLISVIVPVFNAEEFLDECIESILNQTYENCEIILIDDGSTDASGQICDYHSAANPKVLTVHTNNSGVSSARNTGLELASGKYVTFVDSDDTINENYIQFLFNDTEKFDADVVTTTTDDITGTMQGLTNQRVADEDILSLEPETTILELYKGVLEGTRNGVQFIKHSVLKDNSLRYDERMAVGEDFDFFARVILVSNRIVVDKRKMYYYRSNPKSAMMQSFNKSHFDAIRNVEKIGRKLQSDIPGLSKAVDTMLFSDSIYYGAKAVPVREEWPKEYKEICSLVREYRIKTLLNRSAKRNTRVKALIVSVLGVDRGLRLIRRMIRW